MKHLSYPEFTEAIKNTIVVVDFYAQRCPPCKMISPYLDSMATQYQGIVDFYKVDVDEQQYLAGIEWITAMPTLKIYKQWALYKTIIWADLQHLQNTIEEIITSLSKTS